MIKSGLIGRGYWGEVIHSKLKDISEVVFTCTSSDSYIDKIKGVDWVFIATPNETHYDIVLKCLELRKNVFCEKPLTLTLNQSEKLYAAAKKYNIRLYVDDIQRYIGVDYYLKDKNLIERKKNSQGDYCERDLLYRLAYHDIYTIYDDVKNSKINNIEIINTSKNLHFKILFEGILVEFFYDVKFKEKPVHHINGISLMDESYVDPLFVMLTEVVNESADFDKNMKVSLFANYIIDRVNEKF